MTEKRPPYQPQQPYQPRQRTRRRIRRRNTTLPSWATGALIGFFVLTTALAAWLIFAAVRNFVASANVPVDTIFLPEDDSPSAVVDQPGVGEQPVEFDGVLPVWGGTDRVTVLVLGIDQRLGVGCQEEETAYRTDTIMLTTLDPVGNTASMLSIPRDLYVTIPGFEERDRINKANFNGDIYQLPGGGPQLAMDTIEFNLGIHIDYYVRLNFTVVETLINEIGGIEVDVLQAIDDPTYPDPCYGFDPFYLPAGRQHLDGPTALKYARTRATFGADFDRTARQQQVILAVRDKITSLDMLPQLLPKVPGLYSTLADGFDSNLTLEQMIALGLKAMDVPRDSIRGAVIDTNYILEPYTTPDGQQVVLLDTDAFRELREELFYTPTQPELPGLDITALMAGEGAQVEVHNGSTREGLAGSAADYLSEQGLNVTSVGNAARFDYATTVIIDYTGRPYTTRWLANTFGVQSSSIFAENNPDSQVDILLIIGADFVLPNSP